MLYKTTVASPLGNITLASDGTALTGLWFEGQKYYMGTWKEPAVENNDLAIFHQTKQWLCAYFAGKQPDMGELYLKPAGRSCCGFPMEKLEAMVIWLPVCR